MPPKELWVMKCPVISTAHISMKTDDALLLEDLAVNLGMGCGWLIPAVHEEYDDLPDLQACMKWAEEQGFEWLRLDPDGDVIAELPTYDWR